MDDNTEGRWGGDSGSKCCNVGGGTDEALDTRECRSSDRPFPNVDEGGDGLDLSSKDMSSLAVLAVEVVVGA